MALQRLLYRLPMIDLDRPDTATTAELRSARDAASRDAAEWEAASTVLTLGCAC